MSLHGCLRFELVANLLGRRLSTADGAARSAEDAAATDLAVEGHRIDSASRQHSVADEGPVQNTRSAVVLISATTIMGSHDLQHLM